MSVGSNLLNKKVLIRTYSAGVHFGTLIEREGKECLLENSRRVHYWSQACSLSQLAVDGDGAIDKCRIAKAVTQLLTECIEVIEMSEKACDILYGAKEWAK